MKVPITTSKCEENIFAMEPELLQNHYIIFNFVLENFQIKEKKTQELTF